MTDELTGLLARARQLEQENASLRSIQSPDGDDLELRCENAMLSSELERLRTRAGQPAPPPGPGDEAPMPRTPAEFNALSADRRRRLAHSMTRSQRDRLLGRGGLGGEEGDYL